MFNIEHHLNKSQTWASGYYEISHATMLVVDHLLPRCISFIKGVKMDDNCWIKDVDGAFGKTLSSDDLKLLNRFHSIIVEYDTLTRQHDKVLESENSTGEDILASEAKLEEFYYEVVFGFLSDIAPDGYYFGAGEGDGSSLGYWKSEEEDNYEDEDDIEIEKEVTPITPFDPESPRDCTIEDIPPEYNLITDSQSVGTILDRIGRSDLKEYFNGLFVWTEDGGYSGIYGFVGTVPYNWKPCWKIV